MGDVAKKPNLTHFIRARVKGEKDEEHQPF